MNTVLRVLIVEDFENDVLLLLRELRKGGYEPEAERVDNAAAMYAALARQSWDVVISDYRLPSFSASSALKIWQESGLDIPFIIVSNVIGEDAAVAAMKGGAHDYVMKGNLTRLVPVVSRELREAARRRRHRDAEEKIKRQHQRQSVLRDINLAVTSTIDFHSVMHILMDQIDLLLPYSAILLRLFNTMNGKLEAVASRNLKEEEWIGKITGASYLFSDEPMEDKTPVVVKNVQEDPRILDREFFRNHSLVSYLGVPMVVKGKVLGVLSFFTRQEHDFDNDEVEFLSTLAGQAAMAIHNSQIYEQAVRQAGELEKANNVKTEFLNIVSHELRTPLNVIMGYTGLIMDKVFGEINPEQQKILERVMRQSNNLLTMIVCMLEATRIEADAVSVENHGFSLMEFLADLRSIYEVPLHKPVTMSFDYPSDLPPVRTDLAKLRQILQNLISNAIKFTDEGSVIVSARYAAETETVEFRVVDTGIGIPQEGLALIFEKFQQIDGSQTRLHGGVGLGLHLVEKFTELLGGAISVESEPGKGSTFTVTIPRGDIDGALAAVSSPAQAPALAVAGGNGHGATEPTPRAQQRA